MAPKTIEETPHEELFGERVRVHRNLHPHKDCYVICQKGRVVQYVRELVLEDVEFRVSDRIRERIKQGAARSVHARAWGTLVRDPSRPCTQAASYNPREPPHDFHILETGQRLVYADCVRFADRIMYVPDPVVVGPLL